MVYEILVPPPAIQHRALALEAQSLHWTAREDSQQTFFHCVEIGFIWNIFLLKRTKQNKMLSLAFSTYPGHCNGL